MIETATTTFTCPFSLPFPFFLFYFFFLNITSQFLGNLLERLEHLELSSHFETV